MSAIYVGSRPSIYSGEIRGVPVHQYITQEAVWVWREAPTELKRHAVKNIYSKLDDLCDAKYDSGDDIVIGSGEEDQEWNAAFCPRGRVPAPPAAADPNWNGYFEHFWDPDKPNGGRYDAGLTYISPVPPNRTIVFRSSYWKAQTLWNTKIIPVYRLGVKRNDPDLIGQAYYWLGRVAHLLEDATVPAHVHDVPHDLSSKVVLGGVDPFEGFLGEDAGRVLTYSGRQLAGQEYRYEDLPGISIQKDFAWTRVHPNPTNLFKLFWYTAQKTQYFAAGGGTILSRPGDAGQYVEKEGKARQFRPSLWEGEENAIIGDPSRIDDTNLPKIADTLVPHAMRAVAGLYRLFWNETHPPVIIESVKILEPGPYRVAQKLTAEFTLKNQFMEPLPLQAITVGGRLNGECPNKTCPDFSPNEFLNVSSNGTHVYKGQFTPTTAGRYHFFTAYRTPDGKWNTAIPTVDGVTNTLDITVEPTALSPKPAPQPAPSVAAVPPQPTPRGRFQPDCSAGSAERARAAGGNAQISDLGALALGGNSYLSVDISPGPGRHLFLVMWPGFGLTWSPRNKPVTPNADGTVMFQLKGPDDTGFYVGPGTRGRQTIRLVEGRVSLNPLCDLGKRITGSFTGTFQLDDGSPFNVAGDFSMIRTQ